jgi:hypothetical protein
MSRYSGFSTRDLSGVEPAMLRKLIDDQDGVIANGEAMTTRSYWFELILTIISLIVWVLLIAKRLGVGFKSADTLAAEYGVANGIAPAAYQHYAAEENYVWNVAIFFSTIVTVGLILATLMSSWSSNSLAPVKMERKL